MASLRALPNSPYWIACFTMPDGSRTQRSTKIEKLQSKRREAQRIANQFDDAARDGGRGLLTETQARKVIADIYARANQATLPGSTIGEYCESWLKRKEIESGERTHERYSAALGHFRKIIGPKVSRDLSHLTARDVSSARDRLSKQLSAGSANFMVKVLRAMLNQASRDGLVTTNEASRVTFIRRRKRTERRPFTLGELKRLLAVSSEEWKGMILVGLYTGLRLGDIANLSWLNLDLQQGEIALTTGKTGRRQVIPLAAPLRPYIEGLAVGDDPSAPVFPQAHESITRNGRSGPLSTQFYSIMVAAGLAEARRYQVTGGGRSQPRTSNEISFHCLRHTATSLLKNAGVSDVIARDIIGHESEAVSRAYTHIDDSTKRAALDKMPDVLG